MQSTPITYDELLQVIPAIHLPLGIDLGSEGAVHIPQVPATRKGRTLVVSKAHADDGLILREAIPALQACNLAGIPLRLAPPTALAVLRRRTGMDRAEASHIARRLLVQYVEEVLDGIVEPQEGGVEAFLSTPNSVAAVIRPGLGHTPEQRTMLRRGLSTLHLHVRWLCVEPDLHSSGRLVTDAHTATNSQAAYMLCVHVLIKRLQELYQQLDCV